MAGPGGSGRALHRQLRQPTPARRSCQTRAPRPPVLPVPTAPPRAAAHAQSRTAGGSEAGSGFPSL